MFDARFNDVRPTLWNKRPIPDIVDTGDGKFAAKSCLGMIFSENRFTLFRIMPNKARRPKV
jgi:hypothetical protein